LPTIPIVILFLSHLIQTETLSPFPSFFSPDKPITYLFFPIILSREPLSIPFFFFIFLTPYLSFALQNHPLIISLSQSPSLFASNPLSAHKSFSARATLSTRLCHLLLFVLTSFFTSPLDRPSQPPLETRDSPSLCTCFPFRPLDADFLPSYVALSRWTRPRVRELMPPLHPTVADFGFLGQRPWVRTMPLDLARTPSRRTEPFPAPPSCCLSSDLPNRAQPISPLLLRIIIGNFFPLPMAE
jgi:hypothetical protein